MQRYIQASKTKRDEGQDRGNALCVVEKLEYRESEKFDFFMFVLLFEFQFCYMLGFYQIAQ